MLDEAARVETPSCELYRVRGRLEMIQALNAFAEVYAMTSGGPNVDVGGRALGATWVTGYYVFDTFYTQFKLGYAAAMSYVLLGLTLLISVVNRRFLRAEV